MIVPFGLIKAGFNFPIFSMELGLTPLSSLITFSLPGILKEITSSKLPSSIAFLASVCERRANSSCMQFVRKYGYLYVQYVNINSLFIELRNTYVLV